MSIWSPEMHLLQFLASQLSGPYLGLSTLSPPLCQWSNSALHPQACWVPNMPQMLLLSRKILSSCFGGGPKPANLKNLWTTSDLPMSSWHFPMALNPFSTLPSPKHQEIDSSFPNTLPPYSLYFCSIPVICPLLTRKIPLISESLPVALSWAAASVLLVSILLSSAALIVSFCSLGLPAGDSNLHSPFSYAQRFEKFNTFWQRA